MKVGVLDQCPIAPGEDAAQAIANTIELAKLADRLGYDRYWVAEHHASKTLACSSPEIFITRLAAETKNIRVGSGGVMLSHYSPYKVAENFRVLEVMYPGRIDLGVGRAPGSDGLTAAALAYGSRIGIEYYPAKVQDLAAFVAGQEPITEAFSNLQATPIGDSVPELWLLASSADSAYYAATFGLNFSFAHFISPKIAAQVCNDYRKHFKPSAATAHAYVNLGVFAICAEDAEHADLLMRCREIMRRNREQGRGGGWPTLEEARAHSFSASELDEMRQRPSRQLIGTPGQVVDSMASLVEECHADEVVVLTICPDFGDRQRSYELLARELRLSPPGR